MKQKKYSKQWYAGKWLTIKKDNNGATLKGSQIDVLAELPACFMVQTLDC